jgi:uncharacterized ferritin-like protein (DUF455 family)
LSPGYSRSDHPPSLPYLEPVNVLDELVQMNVGEIRTRIHQLLLRPVLTAHCTPRNRKKLTQVLDSLLRDETRHIAYTARFIETAASKGKESLLREISSQRLDEFNEMTLHEVGDERFVGE